MSPGARALLSKLELYTVLGPLERRMLSDLLDRPEQAFVRGRDLVPQGGVRRDGYVFLTGWAARSRMLPDGRRQILSFITPGDVVGLFAAVSPLATSAITALSEVTVVPFQLTAVVGTIGRAPRLGAALVWAASREQEILAELLVSVGRRSARERVAHLFLELWARLRGHGTKHSPHLQVPLTQHIVADTLGLSVVHVNRVLRQLADEGLLTVKRESVTLLDIPKLREVSGFDEDYLRQHAMPADLASELARLDPSEAT